MSQKENEFVSILKNLDKQLTIFKKYIHQRSQIVNNIVPSTNYSFLIWATDHLENEEILEYLINSGANVNNEHDGYTPLLKAIERKSYDKTKMLLSKGANVNHKIQTNDGGTPLTTAVTSNFLLLTEDLIEQGADVNLIGYEGRTPLSWAVERKNIEIIRLLIDNGATVNKPDEDGYTPLCLAIDAKNVEIVRLLIANGANVNQPGFHGKTPLTIARKRANEDILQLLENATLNAEKSLIETVNSEGNTPLENAIRSGKTEIVKRLLKSKPNVCRRGKNGKTPLSIAVEAGNSDIVQLLLENGAEHTIQSSLFEAIRLKKLEIVKILLQKGAILDITCKEGWTPLTKAIVTEDLDIVKVLVENGADVKMPQRDGTTPLSLALNKRNLLILQYLRNHFGFGRQIKSDLSGANFGSLLKDIEDGNFEMVKMLVEMGASLNSIYDDHDTPLTKAVKVENYEIVKYLVKKGADVNQANGEGKVPLAIAATNQDIRIVKFLISARARLDLAKDELEEYANVDDDFAMYLDLLKKENCSCGWERMNNLQHSFQNSGQEAAD